MTSETIESEQISQTTTTTVTPTEILKKQLSSEIKIPVKNNKSSTKPLEEVVDIAFPPAAEPDNIIFSENNKKEEITNGASKEPTVELKNQQGEHPEVEAREEENYKENKEEKDVFDMQEPEVLSPSEEMMDLSRVEGLVDEGKRALALHQYSHAAEKLSIAAEILGNVYGQDAAECADTLFLYGQALYETAVIRNSLLGEEALKSTVDVKESESSTVDPSLADKSASHFVFNGDEESEDEDEGDDIDDQEEVLEEETDDFETAWEVLDLARVIYSKMDTPIGRARVADIHILLGDISLETENFEQAVNDYQDGLNLKLKELEDDNRQLAEAHYKLALAYEYSGNLAEAIDHSISTITVLKKKVMALKQGASVADSEEKGKTPVVAIDVDPESEAGKEIKEIEDLIPDMELKIEELRTQIENQKSKLDVTKSDGNVFSTPKTTDVNDISVLVKKKAAELEAMANEFSKNEGVIAVQNLSTDDDGLKRKMEDQDPIVDVKKPKNN